MAGEMEVLFSLAGRIYVLMRRQSNRMIDVEWMCADSVYAQEVIRLARADPCEELQQLADRVEEVHPLLPRIEWRSPEIEPLMQSKYVLTLR